jgi:hypothetical protein
MASSHGKAKGGAKVKDPGGFTEKRVGKGHKGKMKKAKK